MSNKYNKIKELLAVVLIVKDEEHNLLTAKYL